MFWSKKAKEEVKLQTEATRVEVIANREAKKEVIDKARQINKELNSTLIRNGFTLKIYVAAGGGHPHERNEQ